MASLVLLAAAAAAPAPAGDPPLALLGADVIVRPGAAPLVDATVLVRDGRIEAIGPDVQVPFDARAVDCSGLVLTAGLVDAADARELSFPPRVDQQGRPVDDGRDVLAATLEADRVGLAPEREAWRALPQDAADDGERRRAGFAAVVVMPGGQLLSGTGALLALSSRPPREATLRTQLASYGSLLWRTGPENYEGNRYPVTLMGVMAHLRQVLLDAERLATIRELHAQDAEPPREAQDAVLEALQPVLAGRLALVVEARDEEDIRLALGLQDRFPHLRLVIAGGTEAYELADELALRHVAVVHDLDFGEEPDDPDKPPEAKPGKVGKEGKGAEAATPEAPSATARPPVWNPELPLRLRHDRRAEWLERVAGPARLREAGVLVAFGSCGRSAPDLLDGLRTARKLGGLTAEDALAGLTTMPAEIFGLAAAPEGPRGAVVAGAPAFLTLWSGQPLEEHASARLLVVDGVLFDLRTASEESAAAEAASGEGERGGQAAAAEHAGLPAEPDAALTPTPAPGAPGAKDVLEWPVELDTDREPPFRTGGDVLVRGATIHTASHGTLSDSDLLVRDGKIATIGRGLSAPEGVRVVEAQGLHLIPGIIDCHSHAGIRGGINEWTRVVTPEVTVEDEVDPDDVDLYRALAGGVTTTRLLHGSSNVIGGRHEVIKLRWGKSAPELVFEGAPRGVKFALGENPKHSNVAVSSRFPHTRMGVEAVLRRALSAGQEYREGWDLYESRVRAGEHPDPPRRDLRLEALAGILDGSIRVHSHCYRADEIQMLLRVAEDYGIRVATLQHVLEGYKVAAEIAAHGAGGSTFVDWWGYKFEVYDATPYNAALMTEAGVLVSVNSDSAEHLRRLYLEAAKTIKYGGVEEEQALRMVTLNPAIQLGIDARVGSIDVGKDADFALFDRHPFDARTQCQMTFVDGELYFRRDTTAWDVWRDEVQRRIRVGRETAAGPAAAPTPAPAPAAGEPAPPTPAPAPGAGEVAAAEPHPAETPAPAAPPAPPKPPTEAELATRRLVDERTHAIPADALAPLHAPRDATRAPSTPVRPAAEPVALVGGTVHTMEQEGGGLVVHSPGVVLMRDGRLQGVYAGSEPPPAGYRVVDVSGLQVWPGLIDAGCHVGLAEIDTVAGTMDVSEIGEDQPDLRASAAWHASAEAIPVTRVNGTTLALVVPQGGRVMGQSSAMALEGWTAAEAVVADAVALHLRAPRTPRQDELRRPGEREPPPGSPEAEDEEPVPENPAELARLVDEHWEALDRMFDEAREYARWSGEASRRGVPGPDFDPRLEALAPYALGRALVVVEADAADEIMDALRFGERQRLKLAISGGHEAWKVAHELALRDVPVIVGPVLTLPSQREDPFDSSYHDAAVLADAGVRIAFRSNESASARDLPYHAAMAVAYGLPEDRALRALTAGAAEILGLDSEAGTLTPGKRADVIVTDGSPLQITTQVRAVYIGGRDVGLETRHTRLYERYRQRLLDPGTPSR